MTLCSYQRSITVKQMLIRILKNGSMVQVQIVVKLIIHFYEIFMSLE